MSAVPKAYGKLFSFFFYVELVYFIDFGKQYIQHTRKFT